MKPIRILVADDHAMVRMGLVSLLGTRREFLVVGEAENGEEAIAMARTSQPDVILMDLLMPGIDGIAATRAIREENTDVRILLLTSIGSSDGISQALQAGASGAILKSDDFSTLAAAIRTVAEGGTVLTDDARQLLKSDPPVPALTARQEEILQSVTRGFTTADIARQLGIQECSVKEHVNAICAKLGAANRTEAVAIALRKHLLKV